jgi:hypothetical protein
MHTAASVAGVAVRALSFAPQTWPDSQLEGLE